MRLNHLNVLDISVSMVLFFSSVIWGIPLCGGQVAVLKEFFSQEEKYLLKRWNSFTQEWKFCHDLLTLKLNLFLLLNRRKQLKKIFWRMSGTKQLWGSISFHSMENKYYGSQWWPTNVWFQTFFKISSFVFSRRKKCIMVWNNLSVSKWWQNFHFWMKYPFNWNCLLKLQSRSHIQ